MRVERSAHRKRQARTAAKVELGFAVAQLLFYVGTLVLLTPVIIFLCIICWMVISL